MRNLTVNEDGATSLVAVLDGEPLPHRYRDREMGGKVEKRIFFSIFVEPLCFRQRDGEMVSGEHFSQC